MRPPLVITPNPNAYVPASYVTLAYCKRHNFKISNITVVYYDQFEVVRKYIVQFIIVYEH